MDLSNLKIFLRKKKNIIYAGKIEEKKNSTQEIYTGLLSFFLLIDTNYYLRGIYRFQMTNKIVAGERKKGKKRKGGGKYPRKHEISPNEKKKEAN